MPRRIDVYIDTTHDDDAKAREYVEQALAELKAPDGELLYAEVREVTKVAGYEPAAPSE